MMARKSKYQVLEEKKIIKTSYIKDALKMLASVEDYKKATEQLNLNLGK